MRESFKTRLQAGQAADGCFLEMFNPIAAEIVAEAGFDSVLIDLEHGPGGVLDAIGLIHAVQGSGCAVLLRVEENHPVPIKRALDIGLILMKAHVMVMSILWRICCQVAASA